jgi:hypothetical protein
MRVCMTFYRTVALPLIAISLICAHQVWQSQSAYFIFRVFWVKLLTTFIIGTYIGIFRNEQFIFYNNLGFSRTRLFLYVFLFDFSIWLFMMFAISEML